MPRRWRRSCSRGWRIAGRERPASTRTTPHDRGELRDRLATLLADEALFTERMV